MTLFSRKRITYSFYFELWFALQTTFIVIAAIVVSYKMYSYHNIIKEANAKIQSIETNCPEIKLGRSTILPRGIIEHSNNTRKCIYNIEEYVVYAENARKFPKDSKYLQRKTK